MRPIGSEQIVSLTRLLQKPGGTPYAPECLSAIQDGCEVLGWLGPGTSSKHLWNIYSSRAEHVRRNRLPIFGIDELVASLAAAPDASVLILSVDGPHFNYMIFTDEALATLFGIIRLDASPEWRDRLRPGLDEWLEEAKPKGERGKGEKGKRGKVKE